MKPIDVPVDIEKARREELRWILLRTLDVARPVGLNEAIIMSAVVDLIPDITLQEVRRELDYLESRELVELERNRVWFAKLTRVGTDIVDYTIDCHPGIARPKQG